MRDGEFSTLQWERSFRVWGNIEDEASPKKGEITMGAKKAGIVMGIILLIEACFTVSVWPNEIKVGCVDLQKALNECQAGLEAKKVISKEMEKLQKLFEDRQKELQTMKESLDKQSPMMKPEARAAKEKEFQTRIRDYQRWLEDNQKDIQQKGREMERTIAQGLQKVIKKIGEEEGYTVVLESGYTLFSSKAIDLTDRVIKAYDAQKK
jgi:outer membrane protein